ncbi:LysM peptidoglycan-binding domain-containing protein [Arthrobacter sp. M4]|uniref:LysM peptidoglycan-binding domain-containing protein n=1 Tax=Arthrobacter sp. M4 TaxID=218160 RepID=UPI001CDD6322|nr:LysM peptidoglycan-binding domain-containing protein [Arthrobacter sp. M4]MCA4134657.1 LysM peptidoglycan-binding domain-containing protein [Arthrobacter sp. M4]
MRHCTVSGSRASQPPLKLTRRGRVVFFGVPVILLAAVLLGMAGFLNSPAKAADIASELHQSPTVSVTVQAGDTLWSIAAEAVPHRDVRDVVADIAALNNLDGGRVLPGQQLFVPREK